LENGQETLGMTTQYEFLERGRDELVRQLKEYSEKDNWLLTMPLFEQLLHIAALFDLLDGGTPADKLFPPGSDDMQQSLRRAAELLQKDKNEH
jgi:hypothetical protein